jgi:hypothetical protein
VGVLVALALAATLAGCAGKHRNAKNQSGAEYCATEQQELTKLMTQERDQAPRLPSDAEVARWHRLESAHFALSTDLDLPTAEHTLRELEDYYAALTSIAFPVTPPAIRIPVIGLASIEETRRYFQPCFNGRYLPDVLYQPLIVLGTGRIGIEDDVARHELVHYVMRLAYGRSLPLWYAEGMASYFETLAYDQRTGQLMFGRATLGRVHSLRETGPLLPVGKLVNGGFDDTAITNPGVYYASCWLLTHALIHGAPSVFERYDKELLAGADGHDAWARATGTSPVGGTDAWLTAYYEQRRYEGGRRTRWQPPAETFTQRPMTAADVLTTLALLHTMGTGTQSVRSAWHRAHALADARWALERDPTQLDALQIGWELGTPPSVEQVRPAMPGREQNWAAWMVMASALARERVHEPERVRDPERHDAERHEALMRAAALNPNEPKVLLARAGDALEFRHWDQASQLFERGLPFAADEPRFAQGYVSAMTHDGRCGTIARNLKEHTKADGPKNVWIAAAHTLADCRAHGAPGTAASEAKHDMQP